MKKVLSIVIALVLALSSFCFVFAEGEIYLVEITYDASKVVLTTESTGKSVSDALLKADISISPDILYVTDFTTNYTNLTKKEDGEYVKLNNSEEPLNNEDEYYLAFDFGFTWNPDDPNPGKWDLDRLPTIMINGKEADDMRWTVASTPSERSSITAYKKVEVTEPGAFIVTKYPDSLDVSARMDGNTLYIENEDPVRVAYLINGGLVPVEAVHVEGNEYSFTPEDDIAEVFVMLKGDTNFDGRLTNADSTKLKAAVKGMTELDHYAQFVSDVNGDGSLTNADSTKLKAVIKGMSKLSW